MKRRSLLYLLICLGVLAVLVFTYVFYNSQSVLCSVDTNLLKIQQVIPWGVESLNAPALWSQTTGKNVKIAVMDSGFDFQHPDFGQNIKKGYNAIDPNQLPEDDYGHGTLVTGVIAAKNNSIGVVGVAPDAEIYPVKVLDKYGEGDISDIARGIDWCIENKIHIINMSFAIEEDKPLLRSAVEKAIHSGIIIVASASNSFNGKVGYPASYDDVISITSVDEKKRLGEKSPNGKIEFSAPGVRIISTSNVGGYEEFSGNSLAAPHITGLIALIMQTPDSFGINNTKNSRDDLYNVLKRYSESLGVNNKDSNIGYGFVSLNKLKNK